MKPQGSVNKNTSLDPTLSQPHVVNALKPYFYVIHFNTVPARI
jgi:hypothetical protein